MFNARRDDKGGHAFSDGISSKVNVITRLEFELTYYNSTIQLDNHRAMGTFPSIVLCVLFDNQYVNLVWIIKCWNLIKKKTYRT